MNQTVTPPNELAAPPKEGTPQPTTLPMTPPGSTTISRSSSYTNTTSQAQALTRNAIAAKVAIDLTRPTEPSVTWGRVIDFIIWGICMALGQLWRDLSSGSFYKPLLSSDFMTHYFYIPMARREPRLIMSAPHSRLMMKSLPAQSTTARKYEEIEDLSMFGEREMINCASSNYSGFSELEPGIEKVMEAGLRKLPFCPAPQLLEDSARTACARYMGFDEALTAPSGYNTNVIAFATVAGVASSQGQQLVFLMDRDCHSSMFTGAYYNKGAHFHKFNHNDIADMEYKLRMYREQDPNAFICVAIEGIYSMEGSVSPGPAILALKKIYNFCLLIDEAHSFISLGSSGKGSFNYWQDAGYDCPLSSVDVMTCTFSKSIGCTGGFVLANGKFAREVREQGKKILNGGVEKLSTIILLRVLSLLRKPMLVERRMSLLREKAVYIANTLRSAGCKVLSYPGSAVICFPVGTVQQAIEFHAEAWNRGLCIAAGVPPATPMWGCRIRISIMATLSWPDIHTLLTNVIKISLKLKITGVKFVPIDASLLERQDESDDSAMEQSRAVNYQLLEFIDFLSIKSSVQRGETGSTQEIVDTGIQALHKYSIGPASARWFWGSFDAFIHLEQRLARLYPSLVAQSGRCRGMICADAEVGLGSAISALAIPLASSKVTNTVFVAAAAPKGILDGAGMSKDSKAVTRKYYNSAKDIPNMMDIRKPTHLTFYFLTCTTSGQSILDLPGLMSHPIFHPIRAGKHIASITIMLDDRYGLGKIGPNKLGYIDHMESLHGPTWLVDTFARFNKKVRIIVAGSWYNAFGHQGGYVTGHADTVESLTWNTKAYFFSSPPMPLQACMTNKTIELLQKQRDSKGGVEKIEKQ